LFSCETNKKLNQENAENVIKEFANQNCFNACLWQKGSFSANSITSIEPISQFTESEASAIAHFDFQDSYAEGNLVLKFNFKKNMDKKWVLTSVNAISGVGSQGMSDRIHRWQDLNILLDDNPRSNKFTFFNKTPKINVRIFERVGIFYDSEGWPVDEGVLKEVIGFDKSRNYRKSSEYDYIEKIRIEGKSEDLKIQVRNSQNESVFEKSGIVLNDSIVYTSSDPTGQEGKNFQKWMETRFELLTIKIFYKEKILFEGIIDCK